MKIAETLILILQVVILGLIIAQFTGCSSLESYKASGTIEYGDYPDPSTPNV
jgi:hypothetical protein